jgi:competence protein ComEC
VEQGGSRAKVGTWPAGATTATSGLAALRPHGQALWGWLRGCVKAERGPGRLLPWLPVALGAGIALYFTADHEPVAFVAALTAAGLAIGAFALRRHHLFALAVLLAAAATGFAVAALKTARVAHPVLAKPLFGVALQGFVESREQRERSDRFVLRVTSMEAARSTTTLQRVRLSVRKGTAPAAGSFVALKARLTPPMAPLQPGAYDFARDLYFQGIGATGWVQGAVTVKPAPQDAGFALRYAATLQGIRDAIDARIRVVLEGDDRAIATALLTGRRDAISAPVNDVMFVSGLGHVLSISGYHMAVVAGVVFFAVRALLALLPALTVSFPIKKCAAGAALATAAFYLALSGAEVATQRSFLMTAVVLIAMMVDRQAITFRTLAIAALIVLLLAPEALVHPSFQMSFAATLGLVALVQLGLPALFASPDQSGAARAALWGAREIALLALASLVAGLATLPYAAYHFHRVTAYGVLANLLAMPVVSALVMPAGLLGLVAMPFGLDTVFWRIMAIGIDWLVLVAEGVAALPGAVGSMAAFGVGPLLLATLGLISLALLRSRLRYLGVVLIALAVPWALSADRPDIVVGADGRQVAVRGKDGRLRLLQDGQHGFLLKVWLAADGDRRSPADPQLSAGVSCDEHGCVTALADGRLVSLAKWPEAVAEDCYKAAVLVTRHPVPEGCAAHVVDVDTLRRTGAQSLRSAGPSWRAAVVYPAALDRPWAPRAPSPTDSSARTDSSVDRTPDGAPRSAREQGELAQKPTRAPPRSFASPSPAVSSPPADEDEPD